MGTHSVHLPLELKFIIFRISHAAGLDEHLVLAAPITRGLPCVMLCYLIRGLEDSMVQHYPLIALTTITIALWVDPTRTIKAHIVHVS